MSDCGQPEFAWIPGRKGLSRLLLGPRKRQEIAAGRSLRVLVFSWGFTWINGPDELSAKWSDIACVYHLVTRHSHDGTPTSTRYCYQVRLTVGRTMFIRGRLAASQAAQSQDTALQPVPGTTTAVTIEQLGRLVESAVTADQLPRAIGCLGAGRPVPFGPLVVDQAGICIGDQQARWNEIQAVRTQHGFVHIRKAGKRLAWKTLPVSSIPNYFVFDALVHSIVPYDRPADMHTATSRVRES